MFNKILILLAVTLMTHVSYASPYYRFWRGWKLNSLNYDQFRTAIDQTFIPATVEVGQGNGLLAYIPALLPTPENRSQSLKLIPDEIALVVYNSETEYRRLRETPEGKKYGDLHWEYFDKEKGSQSTVPEPYVSALESNHAYDILQNNEDWQSGYVVYSVSHIVGPLKPLVDSMKSSMTTRGLKSYLVLVGDAYVIEYQLWANKSSYNRSKSLVARLRSGILEPLSPTEETRKSSPYNSGIHFGEGVNANFNTQQEIVSDPLSFSERSTQAYAENTSDMEPLCLDGCDYTNIDEENPSITCMGTRTVLVFGGHEVTGQFTCDFKFARTPTGKFLVVSGTETCQ